VAEASTTDVPEVRAYYAALDACEESAERLCAAAQHALAKGLACTTAVAERLDCNSELDAAFPVWESVIKLRQEYDEASERLKTAAAGLLLLPEPIRTSILADTKARRSLSQTIRAMADYALGGQGVQLGLGIAGALEDSSDRKADQFAGRVVHASPGTVALRHRRLFGMWLRDEDDARHHLLRGMLTLLRRLREREFSPLSGRSRAYLKGAVETIAAEDLRRLALADQDRLEISTKGKRRNQREELDEQAASKAFGGGVAYSPPDDVLAVLIAAEEAAEDEAILDAFRETLPDDQAQLFDLWRAGVPPTEGRERLGLSKSVEGALRGRLARFGKKLAAS